MITFRALFQRTNQFCILVPTMNKMLALCIASCLVMTSVSFSQKKDKAIYIDKEACLALVGYINNTTIIKNITVHLYMGSNLVDSLKPKSSKDFGFILKRNQRYSLHIIAPGYYSRLLIINTDLPDNISTLPLFAFEFELMLLKEKKGMDDFYLDFPIASISYDAQVKKFTFSQKYTSFMEKEVSKAESDFKVRKSTH